MSNIFSDIIAADQKPKEKPKPKKKAPPKKKIKTGLSEETREKTIAIINQNEGTEEKLVVHFNSDDMDIEELTDKASKAMLMKHIQLEELQKFKIEQEKIKLLTTSKDLVQVPFAEFLYYGYIEKCNIDMLAMCRKLKPKIISAVNEKDVVTVVNLINREISSTLETIRVSQERDVKNWRAGK
ncbi:MAG: hypothetical protein GY804_11930 [Alphaproteobacteria bacterium]|nr:hypothetical protein [Alphaproteobacteria bacterium]